jgi:hypothetical protein
MAVRWLRILLGVLVLGAWAGLTVADKAADEADDKLLRDAGIATDGPGLLEFFRTRTLTPARRAELEELIRQLGSRSYNQRKKASRELLARGRIALPLLRQALKNSDLEVVRRAEGCIAGIEQGPGAGLPPAAVRVLARRRPEGAAAALLQFLPSADDELVEEEITTALGTLGVKQGKAGAELVAALRDPEPLRRTAAAAVVGRLADARQRAPVRPLLQDADPKVRYHAAEALLTAGDKEAVPALVGLLRDAPQEIAWRAEGLLLHVAGTRAPQVTADATDAAGRKKWHAAWAGWWQTHGAKLEVPRLGEVPRALGLTLVAEGHGSNQVWGEYGRGGKASWTMANVSYPMDVRALPGGRILVAECDARRVTERDVQGKILWEQKTTGMPLAAQRLPNGNTLIATHRNVAEYTRAGREVFSYTPGDTICDALKLPSGRLLCVNTRGEVRELTVPAGKEVKKIELAKRPTVGTDWYHLEVLPGGRLLVASHSDGRVLEIDPVGKVLWQCRVPQAYAATRLPNGHTLVGRAEGKELVEVDRKGNTVSRKTLKGYLCRVRYQ